MVEEQELFGFGPKGIKQILYVSMSKHQFYKWV